MKPFIDSLISLWETKTRLCMKLILSYNSQLKWSHYIGYEEKKRFPFQGFPDPSGRQEEEDEARTGGTSGFESVELDDVA